MEPKCFIMLLCSLCAQVTEAERRMARAHKVPSPNHPLHNFNTQIMSYDGSSMTRAG